MTPEDSATLRVRLITGAGLVLAALVAAGCRRKPETDTAARAPVESEIIASPEKATERISPGTAVRETNPVLPPSDLPPPPGAVAVEAPAPATISPPAALPSSSSANPNRPPP